MPTPVKTTIPDEMNAQQTEFASLLEKCYNKMLQPGELTVGEVINVDRDHLLVDIGGKCEGKIPLKEIPDCFSEADLNANYKPGQVVECFILRSFEDDNPYLLSVKRVNQRKDWDKLETLCESGELIPVRILSLSRGGLLVQAFNLKGFVPGSQLRVARPIEEMMGEEITVKVLEVDRDRNKLILSQRAAVLDVQAGQRAKTLEKLSVGQLVSGQVLKITDFGAFVDVNGIDGLLPLSEISWRRIHHPSDELALGDMVEVSVLNIDMERQRISLSRKRLSKDPWTTIQERLNEGQELQGTISKFLGTGYLVEIEAGIEGFCSFNHHKNRDDIELKAERAFRVVSVAAQDRRITLEPVALN